MSDVTQPGVAGKSAKAAVKNAGEEVLKTAKRLTKQQAFKNAAAGAALGAVIAVPVPLVGPVAGAIFGGTVGLFWGNKLRRIVRDEQAQGTRPPVDLHAEVTKLGGKPWSVTRLEDFGRTRLSKSFFMRDFLYSDIATIEGIPNVPDDPELAIEAGKRLCQEVLEPIQARFGRIAVRSAFRCAVVNARGAANKNQYNCASNEANYASHIWDHRDANGHMGATACIVVPAFLPYYEKTGDWTALAWWIHDNVPGYSHMQFFPKLAAFNVSWHEVPAKRIRSFVPPKGLLTKPGMENHSGSHADEYKEMLTTL